MSKEDKYNYAFSPVSQTYVKPIDKGLIEFEQKLKETAIHLSYLAEAFRNVEMLFVREDAKANRIEDEKNECQLPNDENPQMLEAAASKLKSGQRFTITSFPITKVTQIKWQYSEIEKECVGKKIDIDIDEHKKNQLLDHLFRVNDFYRQNHPQLTDFYWNRQIEFYKNKASVAPVFSERPRNSPLFLFQVDLNWHFAQLKALHFYKPLNAASIITGLMEKMEKNGEFTLEFCYKIIMTVWVGRDITFNSQERGGKKEIKRDLLPKIKWNIELLAARCWEYYKEQLAPKPQSPALPMEISSSNTSSASSLTSSSSSSSSRSIKSPASIPVSVEKSILVASNSMSLYGPESTKKEKSKTSNQNNTPASMQLG
jgi:hypothetical protein